MPKQTGDFDVSEMVSNLGGLNAKAREAAQLGIRDAAEFVLGRAVDLVPLETGDLSNSGRVSVDDQRLRAYISFDTPYAVPQHEDMTLRHDPGRQAKYLEEPLLRSREEIFKLLARRMQQGGLF